MNTSLVSTKSKSSQRLGGFFERRVIGKGVPEFFVLSRKSRQLYIDIIRYIILEPADPRVFLALVCVVDKLAYRILAPLVGT